MRVAVAMSGGVDSSVAAALMVEEHGVENVFGVTAKLFCYAEKNTKEKACCSMEAISDARTVCDKLGIAHYVINEEKEFEQAVIKNFIEAYRHGQTPIPCIPCNTVIKFGTMLKKVQDLGAEKFVTGHYARVRPLQGSDPKEGYQLLRGVDSNKDQTYFLHGLSEEQLSHIEFPIGELKKPEVRRLAKKYELKTAEKQESQGVCFVSEGTVVDWLADKIERHPGNIVDTKGRTVGQHDGIVFYTIGQRKRIGGGYDEPMFVVAINPLENEVVIGGVKDLNRRELTVGKIHWINEPKLPLKCTAKIRYNMEDQKCTVSVPLLRGVKTTKQSRDRHAFARDDEYIVKFDKPQRAITPGQSIVFYDGEVCLGGGVIAQ